MNKNVFFEDICMDWRNTAFTPQTSYASFNIVKDGYLLLCSASTIRKSIHLILPGNTMLILIAADLA